MIQARIRERADGAATAMRTFTNEKKAKRNTDLAN
jgi:hypothetical protein